MEFCLSKYLLSNIFAHKSALLSLPSLGSAGKESLPSSVPHRLPFSFSLPAPIHRIGTTIPVTRVKHVPKIVSGAKDLLKESEGEKESKAIRRSVGRPCNCCECETRRAFFLFSLFSLCVFCVSFSFFSHPLSPYIVSLVVFVVRLFLFFLSFLLGSLFSALLSFGRRFQVFCCFQGGLTHTHKHQE